jgi:hypothetical protein
MEGGLAKTLSSLFLGGAQFSHGLLPALMDLWAGYRMSSLRAALAGRLLPEGDATRLIRLLFGLDQEGLARLAATLEDAADKIEIVNASALRSPIRCLDVSAMAGKDPKLVSRSDPSDLLTEFCALPESMRRYAAEIRALLSGVRKLPRGFDFATEDEEALFECVEENTGRPNYRDTGALMEAVYEIAVPPAPPPPDRATGNVWAQARARAATARRFCVRWWDSRPSLGLLAPLPRLSCDLATSGDVCGPLGLVARRSCTPARVTSAP